MKIVILCVLGCAIMVLAGVKTDVVNSSVSCSEGWFEFDGRCFHFVQKPMSWSEAEKNCQSVGAHLASVQSIDEYHEIQNLTAPHGYKETWIGGSDAQKENVWIWIDAKKFVYTNWCTGQPSNYARSQHCLQMNYSDNKCWDDVECSFLRPSVCAKRGWGLVD